MLLKNLIINNFMPYYGENTIVFPTDRQSNVVLFFGENTKGKTSILNALRWVLYGEIEQRGKILTYSDFLNKKAKREGDETVFIELNFEAGEDSYMLRRTQGDEDVTAAILLMEKNGKPMDRAAAGREIERIAPSGTKRFFLFDGELLSEYQELMEPNSSTAKKIKRAVEDVMGFPSLLKAIVSLESVEKKLKTQAAKEQTTNNAIQRLRKDRAGLEAEIGGIEKELCSLRENEEQTKLELATVSRDVEASAEMSKLLTQLTTAKELQKGKQENLKANRQELSEMKTLAWKSLLKEEMMKAASEAQENSSAREALATELSTTLISLAAIEKAEVNKTCPTCNQTITDSSPLAARRQELIDNKEKLQKRLDESPDNAAKQKLFSVFGDCTNLIDLTRKEESLLQQEGQIALAGEEILNLHRKIQDYVSDDSLDDQVKKRDRMIQRKTQLQTAQNTLTDAINTNEKNLKSKKGEERKLGEQIAGSLSLEEASKEMALVHCQKVIEIFEEAKDILREDIKSSVESAANGAFLKMISRPDDYSGLKITDTYGLQIIANDGTVVPQRSAGAEQVVALALIDGLNQVGRSPGPVVMDTPFGRLDKTHRRKILEYMPTSARQFVLFVHSGELEKDSEILDSVLPRVGRRYEIKSLEAYVSYMEDLS